MKKECTKQTIIARVIIYKEKEKFQAICLDFNVFAYGDTMEEVEKEIKGAVLGHAKAVFENNLSKELLFRPADQKYWDMLDKYFELMKQKTARKTLQKVKTAFEMPLPQHNLCRC